MALANLGSSLSRGDEMLIKFDCCGGTRGGGCLGRLRHCKRTWQRWILKAASFINRRDGVSCLPNSWRIQKDVGSARTTVSVHYLVAVF